MSDDICTEYDKPVEGDRIRRAEERRNKAAVLAAKSNEKFIDLLVQKQLADDSKYRGLVRQEIEIRTRVHRNRLGNSKKMQSAIQRLERLSLLFGKLDAARRDEVQLSDSLHEVRTQMQEALLSATRNAVVALGAAGRRGLTLGMPLTSTTASDRGASTAPSEERTTEER